MPRNPLAELIERVAELERRQGNMLRAATVTKNENGMLTVTDGAGFDPEPMKQMAISAGVWRIDAPADVGSQGFVFSPEGDPSQARFMPTLDDNAHPHASKKSHTLRLVGPGNEVIEITNGVVNLRNVKVNLGNMGGPGVARLGDQVVCPAGIGHISTSSETVFAVD